MVKDDLKLIISSSQSKTLTHTVGLNFLYAQPLYQTVFPELFQLADHKSRIFFLRTTKPVCGPFLVRFVQQYDNVNHMFWFIKKKFFRTNSWVLSDHKWSTERSLGSTALYNWFFDAQHNGVTYEHFLKGCRMMIYLNSTFSLELTTLTS